MKFCHLVISLLTFALVSTVENGKLASQEKKFTNSLGMEFVQIPKGKFMMGDPRALEYSFEPDEHVHEVEITKDFFVAKFEVTQAQFESIMGFNPSVYKKDFPRLRDEFREKAGKLPVEQVTWNQAVEFCKKLTKKEKKDGRNYRLLTEAEWEYACRAGTKSTYSFGEEWKGKANLSRHFPCPSPVGTFEPNKFGLFDFHGNVAEWVADWHQEVYYKKSPKKDPKGPRKGDAKVCRGGTYSADPQACRSASRHPVAPSEDKMTTGIRVACDIMSK